LFTTKVHANADRHRQNIAIEKEKKKKISRITSARSWLAGSFISSFSLVPNRKEERGRKRNLWLAGYWKCSREKEKKVKRKREHQQMKRKYLLPNQIEQTNKWSISNFETPMLRRTDDCTYVD
jgi:hypothetical protein